jgi:hypothetical protein
MSGKEKRKQYMNKRLQEAKAAAEAKAKAGEEKEKITTIPPTLTTAESKTTVETQTTAEPKTTTEPKTTVEIQTNTEPKTTVETQTTAEPKTTVEIQTNTEPKTNIEIQQNIEEPIQQQTPLKPDSTLPTILSIGENGFQEILVLKGKSFDSRNQFNQLHRGTQKELTNLYGITNDSQLKHMQIVFGVKKTNDKPLLFSFLENPCKFEGYGDVIAALEKRAETLNENINLKNDRIKTRTDKARLEWIKNTIQRLKEIEYTKEPPCPTPLPSVIEAPKIVGKEGCPCLEDLNLLRDLVVSIALLLGKANPEIKKDLEEVKLKTLLNRAAKNNVQKKDSITKLIEILSKVKEVEKKNTAVQSTEVDDEIQKILRLIYTTATGKDFDKNKISVDDILRILQQTGVNKVEVNTLKGEIESLKGKISLKEDELLELQSELDKIENESSDTIVPLNSQIVLKKDLEEKNAEISELKQKLQEANAKLMQQEQEQEETKKKIENIQNELDAKVNELGINIQESEEKISELNIKINEVEFAKNTAEKALDVKNNEIKRIETQLKLSQLDKDLQKPRITKLEAQLENAIKESEQKLSSKDKEIKEITLKKNVFEENSKILANQITDLKNKISTMIEGEEKIKLETELIAKQAELSEKNAEIENLQNQLNEALAENENLKKQRDDATDSLRAELNTLKGEKESIQTQLEAENNKLLEIQKQITNAETEKQNAINNAVKQKEDELNTTIKNKNTLILELNTEKENLQKQINELKSAGISDEKINKMNEQMDEINGILSNLQSDLDLAIKENDKLKQQINEINKLNKALEEEKYKFLEGQVTTSSKISELDEQIRLLQAQKLSNNSKINHLGQQLREQHVAKNEEIETLKNQLTTLQNQLKKSSTQQTKYQLQNLLTMILIDPTLTYTIQKFMTSSENPEEIKDELKIELCKFLKYMENLVKFQLNRVNNIKPVEFKSLGEVDKQSLIKEIISIFQQFFIEIAKSDKLPTKENPIKLDGEFPILDTKFQDEVDSQGPFSEYDQYGYLENYSIQKDGNTIAKIGPYDMSNGIKLSKLSVMLIQLWYSILNEKIKELNCDEETDDVSNNMSVSSSENASVSSFKSIDVSQDTKQFIESPLGYLIGKKNRVSSCLDENSKILENQYDEFIVELYKLFYRYTKLEDIIIFMKDKIFKEFFKGIQNNKIRESIIKFLNILKNDNKNIKNILNNYKDKYNKSLLNILNYDKEMQDKFIDIFINTMNNPNNLKTYEDLSNIFKNKPKITAATTFVSSKTGQKIDILPTQPVVTTSQIAPITAKVSEPVVTTEPLTITESQLTQATNTAKVPEPIQMVAPTIPFWKMFNTKPQTTTAQDLLKSTEQTKTDQDLSTLENYINSIINNIDINKLIDNFNNNNDTDMIFIQNVFLLYNALIQYKLSSEFNEELNKSFNNKLFEYFDIIYNKIIIGKNKSEINKIIEKINNMLINNYAINSEGKINENVQINIPKFIDAIKNVNIELKISKLNQEIKSKTKKRGRQGGGKNKRTRKHRK